MQARNLKKNENLNKVNNNQLGVYNKAEMKIRFENLCLCAIKSDTTQGNPSIEENAALRI